MDYCWITEIIDKNSIVFIRDLLNLALIELEHEDDFGSVFGESLLHQTMMQFTNGPKSQPNQSATSTNGVESFYATLWLICESPYFTASADMVEFLQRTSMNKIMVRAKNELVYKINS